MPKPQMTKSLEMITSYKAHASPIAKRRIDRLAQMYERYEIPARKVVLDACKALTAEDEPTRTKGLEMYHRLTMKYSKAQYYSLSSPSDDEQDDSSEDLIGGYDSLN